MKKKFLIVTTVADSLPFFKGQLNVLKEKFEIHLVSSPGHQLKVMCDLHAVKGNQIPIQRNISILKDLVSLFKLIKLFFAVKPFIVHGNTPKGGLLAMVAAWITNVPKRIYYVHGLRYEGHNGRKKRLLMAMERLACSLSTHVIAVSQGIKQTLHADGIYKKDIHLIWNGSVNGIDEGYFDRAVISTSPIAEELRISKQDFVFGFVGRLVGDKGINELVEVFEEISKNYKNVKLLLVGEFESELDSLKVNTLSMINTNVNIIKIGFQKDIRPYLKLMNVFVFPSYREGLGIVLMEAAAMNLPAISSNISGCNEIIIDGKNGLLVTPKSNNDLKIKMEYCLLNPQVVKNMALITRGIIVSKFSQKELWQKALEKYISISNQ